MFVDYSQLQPIAVVDQLTGLWLKTQVTPLFGPLVLFSQTFPASGMTHGGKLFVPLMQGQPTTGQGSSSLPSQQIQKLPTPVANDMGGNKTIEWWDEWCAKTKAKHNNSNGHGPSLNIEVLRLMPTPNTMDGLPARSAEHIAESKLRTPAGYSNLRETVVNDLFPTPMTTAWGKFAPAIERWEAVINREAPAPTKPDGQDGQHRLSAEFTEWMMGLPAGWVTDPELGLTRNEQLKLCGNGVVPQQAALALTRLLTGIDLNKEEQK